MQLLLVTGQEFLTGLGKDALRQEPSCDTTLPGRTPALPGSPPGLALIRARWHTASQ